MRITGKRKKFVGRRKIYSKIAICFGQQKTLGHTGIFIGIFKAKFDSSFPRAGTERWRSFNNFEQQTLEKKSDPIHISVSRLPSRKLDSGYLMLDRPTMMGGRIGSIQK